MLVVFEGVEALHVPLRLSRPERAGSSFELSCPERNEEHHHATIRRYEGVDQDRATELMSKVNETLVPKLSKPRLRRLLPHRGRAASSAHSVFLRQPSREESSNVLATWIRDEKLETLIPNAPKITTGEVVAHSNGVTRA